MEDGSSVFNTIEFSEDSYDPGKRVTLRINKDDSLEQILKLLSIINDKTYEIKEKTKEIVLQE